MDDRSRALSALHTLDPGCQREQWHEIGRAAIAAGLSIDDIDQWSSAAPNYTGTKDVKASFRTVTPEGGTGAGTLYKLAFDAGWNDPMPKARQNGRGAIKSTRLAPSPGQPEKNARQPNAAALAFWERCQPANEAHPYITNKGGTADGLRIVPNDRQLTINNTNVSGWLVVPARSLSGELRTLQTIAPPDVAARLKAEGKPPKLSMGGAPFHDGLFIVGDLAHSPRVFIVEGIGQAWACWSATGYAAAVTFGAGRFKAVAEALRQHSASLALVFVPDRGKEHQAAEIARAVSGEWVEFPPAKPGNYDANDFAGEYGADRLAELLSETKKPPQRFPLLTAAELCKLPGISWRVRGVIPTEGIGAIYGASTSGKSFLTLDMLAAIATGRQWFGCRVKAAPVLYVALEGEAGISNRVQAYQAEHGALPDAFRFLLTSLDIRKPTDRAELVKAIKAIGKAGGVMVLDTLNRAAPGMDENDSRDMGEVISAAKAMQGELSGLVLLVHHTGKDGTKGMRGHSSLHAALDAAIEVRRDGDSREWLIAKAKDGQDGEGHPFRLEVVELGTDGDGDPITSCVVVPEQRATEATKRRTPKGGNQRIVWDALGELLRASNHFGKASAPPARPCVELEAAVSAIAPRLTCEDKRKQERTRQAITGLLCVRTIEHRDGWLWVP